jgi:hypothetical protein
MKWRALLIAQLLGLVPGCVLIQSRLRSLAGVEQDRRTAAEA